MPNKNKPSFHDVVGLPSHPMGLGDCVAAIAIISTVAALFLLAWWLGLS